MAFPKLILPFLAVENELYFLILARRKTAKTSYEFDTSAWA